MTSSLSPALKATLLTVSMFASSALAATTGSVVLGGTVASTLTISAVNEAAAASLPLGGAAAGVQQIVKVAVLTTSTNSEQGFTLTTTSANAGVLTKAGGTGIPYQVTTMLGATAATFATFTFAPSAIYTVSTAAAGEDVRGLWVMYTPAAIQDPGDYAGTISLTVSDL